MKKKFRYITYALAGLAIISALLITKDKLTAEAANNIYLNETNLTLELGRYRTLKVKGTNKNVSWKSANPRAATVSSNGRVTAKGWGKTKIYATVGNKTLTCNVTIVQMNKKNVTLAVNKTSQLTLWGANDTVTWKSSNNKVATVSDTGLVKAKSVGEATITATFNGKKISSQINVVELNTDKVVLEYGGMFDATRSNFGTVKTLKVIGSQDKVSWTSSNKNVATVNSSGKVTAKGPGNATITANINGAKITCNVKVLQMSFSKLELSKGENFSLNVLGTDSPILWFSNKKSVAIVSEDGVVTAKNKGTAKIIAEVDGILVRSIVTVK
ncbi:Ig-like domain-containing protein [Herbinix luporum]|jgi:chitinase|uniref:BIG2 domain-containing protein n=1 Tax=Herbinix luporum TaxID=1679721 RepID=A0A0K8J5T2_9FIRM|nr:Ig-like domain-containing protein [Herbinix luporum]MDI9488056.1 Ig-like domain-containing protein [Bacillota bacterium]CUH92714.1 hypothetical protein SD1D_1168 [Herbinix luporum]HHT56121.1 Ig domain-containing protein [Herbinix luporum]